MSQAKNSTQVSDEKEKQWLQIFILIKGIKSLKWCPRVLVTEENQREFFSDLTTIVSILIIM